MVGSSSAAVGAVARDVESLFREVDGGVAIAGGDIKRVGSGAKFELEDCLFHLGDIGEDI